MSTDPTHTQILVRPEVAAFVDEVRRRLSDLDDETRDDLTGGLEADLSDQLADGTPLGEPDIYAAELRAAAGLPESGPRRLPRLPDLRDPAALLDASRTRWASLVERHRVAPAWDVLVALRPAWWVARAWVAVTSLDMVTGTWEPLTLVPTLGAPYVGEVLLLAAVAISTLIGLGKLWPGSGPDRTPASRTVLVLLNTAAVLAPFTWSVPWPGTEDHTTGNAYNTGYREGARSVSEDSLRLDGRPIRNLFAYDVHGRPIVAVQLFDQDGDPVVIDPRASAHGRGTARSVGCPAYNGEVPAYNVFPLGQLQLRRGTCAGLDDPDALKPDHPLASVPPLDSVPSPHDQPADPRRTPGPGRTR
ncbi:hypothetical protein [Nocardioides stalactiti]|uniref:hypothetical protein n=1 Tax=Nocardioides stalactiti TaxID=2755356 RepID=UPI00160440B0|nr:hypothetical protein [Nocardioides stalactiti]